MTYHHLWVQLLHLVLYPPGPGKHGAEAKAGICTGMVWYGTGVPLAVSTAETEILRLLLLLLYAAAHTYPVLAQDAVRGLYT